MNRVLVATFSFVILVIASVVSFNVLYDETATFSSACKNEDFVIIIDAGHGGEDGGTSAEDGTLEKNINLSISKYLKDTLNAAGYKTLMTRSNDSQIGDNTLPTIRQRKISDIRTRLQITKEYPNAVMISIHQNHYSSARFKGTQVFYSPNAIESKLLAETIQNSVKNNLQPDNTRCIKETGTNIYLLYNCQIPAVMVECGFMSNTEETEKLKSDDYQQKLAFCIMCGIQRFLEEQNG